MSKVRGHWSGLALGLPLLVAYACSAGPDAGRRASTGKDGARLVTSPPVLVSVPTAAAASAPAEMAGGAAATEAAPSGEGGATASAPEAARYVPVDRPDPGPGSFSCDEEICKAGTEVCAPRTACGGDWPARGCVGVAELAARNYDPTAPNSPCKGGCYSWFDKKLCDGPGDCQTGEVCCYSRSRIIGPCHEGIDGYLDEYECKVVGQGRTPCATAEVCSAADGACRRKGSKCVVDAATSGGGCVVPRRRPAGKLKCGAATCP
ncbi:MAG: hypothetical protein JRI68_06645, partial [Deltaproteobacteria bacterium]|nr:hypothetical protein [Deltaproteobacteria bacterium]